MSEQLTTETLERIASEIKAGYEPNAVWKRNTLAYMQALEDQCEKLTKQKARLVSFVETVAVVATSMNVASDMGNAAKRLLADVAAENSV